MHKRYFLFLLAFFFGCSYLPVVASEPLYSVEKVPGIDSAAWSEVDVSSDGQHIVVAENSSYGGTKIPYIKYPKRADGWFDTYVSYDNKTWDLYDPKKHWSRAGGYVYISHDGGKKWSKADFIPNVWGAVTITDNGQTIYLAEEQSSSDSVNSYSGRIFVSHDGGKTWKLAPGVGQAGWASIDVSPDGKHVVAGASFETTVYGSEYEYIYTSHDSGKTWQRQVGAGKARWGLVLISDNGSKILALDYGSNYFPPTFYDHNNKTSAKISEDGGATWKTVSVDRIIDSVTLSEMVGNVKYVKFSFDRKIEAVLANGIGTDRTHKFPKEYDYFRDIFVFKEVMQDAEPRMSNLTGTLSVQGCVLTKTGTSLGKCTVDISWSIPKSPLTKVDIDITPEVSLGPVFAKNPWSRQVKWAEEPRWPNGAPASGSAKQTFSGQPGEYEISIYEYGTRNLIQSAVFNVVPFGGERPGLVVAEGSPSEKDPSRNATGTVAVTSCYPGMERSSFDSKNSLICDAKATWSAKGVSNAYLVITGDFPYGKKDYKHGFVLGSGKSGDDKKFWVTSGTYTATLYGNGKLPTATSPGTGEKILEKEFTITNEAYTLSAKTSPVGATSDLLLEWSFSVPSDKIVSGWFGLYKVGDPNALYMDRLFTAGKNAGTFEPAVVLPGAGKYEFRYFDSSGNLKSVSNPVTINSNQLKNSYYLTPKITRPFSSATKSAAISLSWKLSKIIPGTSIILLHKIDGIKPERQSMTLAESSAQVFPTTASGSGEVYVYTPGEYEPRYVVYEGGAEKVVAVGERISVGVVENAKTSPAACTTNILPAGKLLTPGQTLTSCNVLHTLTLGTDGNLSLSGGWTSGTAGLGAARLAMQSDGNLILQTASKKPLWSILDYQGAKLGKGQYLELKDDGTLAVYDKTGKVRWSTVMPKKSNATITPIPTPTPVVPTPTPTPAPTPSTPTGTLSVTPCVIGTTPSTLSGRTDVCDSLITWTTTGATKAYTAINGSTPYLKNIYPYGYTTPGGNKLNGSNVKFWTPAGTYTVSLYVNGDYSNSKTKANTGTKIAEQTITVAPSLVPVVTSPTGSISGITPCTTGLGKSTADPSNAWICDQIVSFSTENASDVKLVITGDSPYAGSYTASTQTSGSATFWVGGQTGGTYKATLYSGSTKLDEESFTIAAPAARIQMQSQLASVLEGLRAILKSLGR